jgi:hypothetical protein
VDAASVHLISRAIEFDLVRQGSQTLFCVRASSSMALRPVFGDGFLIARVSRHLNFYDVRLSAPRPAAKLEGRVRGYRFVIYSGYHTNLLKKDAD